MTHISANRAHRQVEHPQLKFRLQQVPVSRDLACADDGARAVPVWHVALHRMRAIPKCFCWASCFFGRVGYQGQKTTHFLQHIGFWSCHRRRQGPKTICFWCLGTPGLPKTTWQQKATSGSRWQEKRLFLNAVGEEARFPCSCLCCDKQAAGRAV